MLRRDLGVDVTLEAGPYGSFQVRVDDATVVDAGGRYLVPGAQGLQWAPDEQPWSCHAFARAEIAGPLGLPDESVWFPDPRDPAAYDARIADTGGLDLFLLASGASDGHVAFNPPGSPRASRTRRSRASAGFLAGLSATPTTRRSNRCAARSTRSTCPLVTGSNEPA